MWRKRAQARPLRVLCVAPSSPAHAGVVMARSFGALCIRVIPAHGGVPLPGTRSRLAHRDACVACDDGGGVARQDLQRWGCMRGRAMLMR